MSTHGLLLTSTCKDWQNAIVDDGVGQVMDALRKKGLDKNTLVIFSSDQGNFYGQHGLWQHTVVTTPTNLYEAAMNVPLIIRHPGVVKAGQQSDALIGQYDLPATILDFANVQNVEFENSPGKSFAADLVSGEAVTGREHVYYEQEETRGVRTVEFAYWERINTVGEAELYDMQSDPGQLVNLAGKSEYADVQTSLSTKLHEFFDTYADEKYDLWKGGVAKGSVGRPNMFKQLYGDNWSTKTDMLPIFSE